MLRTSLQRRVSVMGVAFLLLVLVLTLLLAGSVVSLLARGGEERLQTTRQSADHVNAFRADLVRAQTTHWMYVLAGDQKTLDEAQAQRVQSFAALEVSQRALEGDAATLDDDPLSPRLRAAVADVDEWSALVDEQAGYKAAADQAGLNRSILAGTSTTAFLTGYDDLETIATELLRRERTDADTARDEADNSSVVQLVVAAAALLLVPTVLHLVRRWVLLPLSDLSHQLLRVGGGDLQTPVALAGPPELAAVASAAETMRRRILDELADAVSAREALQQGQPLVAEVRDQLAAHDLPLVPGWAAAAALRPAEGLLAGDWYDVLPLPDGRFAVVVADVSGHGARAGIVAIQLKRLLEAALHLAPEPDLALAMAARVFSDEAERFASCVVVVVDPDSGVLTYANAGHPPPLVLRSDGGRIRVVSELEATGPLLSWLHLDTPGAWRTRTASLAPGSSLVVYTDGLTEARPTGSTDELGIEGVLDALAALPELTPQSLVDEALDVARRFSGGRARDDITLVVLARGAAVSAVPSGATAVVPPQPSARERGDERR